MCGKTGFLETNTSPGVPFNERSQEKTEIIVNDTRSEIIDKLNKLVPKNFKSPEK